MHLRQRGLPEAVVNKAATVNIKLTQRALKTYPEHGQGHWDW